MASASEKLALSISGVLAEGEEVEAIVRGLYGTLPGGGYDTIAWNPTSVMDGYIVVLTAGRLLAVRDVVRRAGRSVAFEAQRSTAHCELRRRLVLFDWVGFVFHDRELRLLIHRRWRTQIRLMVDALASSP